MSFAAMKKNRQSQIDKLSGELSKLNQSTPRDDDGFWKPEVDKSGNGSAIIRFLPAPNGEDVPFVRIWDHGFQGPGGWFIEKSLTTLGEKCPVSEYNSMLWNSGTEADKTFVRQKTKRRLSFVSNIYVVKDPSNPDNEGQVFLYKYGKKIFDKLQDQMTPEFDDETPVNPFDLWDGANFRLKIRKVEGYRNYDKSEFDSPSALSEDDDDLESVWKQEKSLKALVGPSAFKSYDELKKRLSDVIGSDVRATVDDYQAPTTAESQDINTSSAPETKVTETSDDSEEVSSEDAFSYFEKLANEE